MISLEDVHATAMGVGVVESEDSGSLSSLEEKLTSAWYVPLHPPPPPFSHAEGRGFVVLTRFCCGFGFLSAFVFSNPIEGSSCDTDSF